MMILSATCIGRRAPFFDRREVQRASVSTRVDPSAGRRAPFLIDGKGHQVARRSRGAADPMRRRAVAGVARAQLEADAIAAGPGNAATRGWT